VTTTDGAKTASCTVTVTGQGTVAVSFQLGSYQALSFYPTAVTLALGTSLSVSPSFASGDSNWQWHVNGSLITTQTSSTLSYTPSLPGFYTISLVVLYNGVLYSGSFNATVTQ
jgi:hypothetical protein